MTRRCPRCGTSVPDDSITCPKCYTEVPRDGTEVSGSAYGRKEYERPGYGNGGQIGKQDKSRTIALILAIVPAFFGILGLGQIYQDRRDSMGWKFLAGGLVAFILLISVIFLMDATGVLGIIMMAVPMIILGGIYVCTAIVSVADVWFGSLRIFGLKF